MSNPNNPNEASPTRFPIQAKPKLALGARTPGQANPASRVPEADRSILLSRARVKVNEPVVGVVHD
ncbi:hypothetical protein PGT21_024575 [Puccinia graminis f. sp. tritici]|uniref:Uncharacterized protein n=1 Tax=Puccinia graminis f. sp. tritici TaxID=56615 RepID=A0A5B0SFZ2_PUCGR|nr:hypothetical protein PGT21_024575 [Puccinia graminis f. sp. tritici]KAA1126407.1 hypothetical protein PGTUg99_000226 [Puccinia graminis f. sp. tritici]KAA1136777.1 hypothetical protein PGTUg99_002176 [Puccinia graminis f. sp. tritici]